MASNAILKEQTLSERVLSMNGHMEELAAAGEWQQLTDFMIKRDAMLSQIEEGEREVAITAARRSTDQIMQLAETARQDIGDRLAALKRGRKAADSYRANT